MELTITSLQSDDGVAHLRLVGALDLASRDELLAAASDALTRSAVGLRLNLAEVSFIDSTGIGAFIELSRTAEDQQKQFSIEEPSQRVQRVLTLTGLNDAWTAPPRQGD